MTAMKTERLTNHVLLVVRAALPKIVAFPTATGMQLANVHFGT